jgi:hypothetical protein
MTVVDRLFENWIRKTTTHPQSSSPGSTGRSSIPETAVIDPMGRGVLDHPVKAG